MTGHAFAMAMAALGVNGPQDDRLDWDAIDWWSHVGQRTAATAEDLHGSSGRGPGQGQELAEVDAAELVEHAGERAGGDAAQCWVHDGGGSTDRSR